MAALVLDRVSTHYGSSHILFGISLEIQQGEVVCLLGRNGAGKTTTIKTIMGLAPASAGTIRFGDRELRGLPPYRIARLGVGYVPDDRLIFPDLTVRENLEIGRKAGTTPDIEEWTVERIYELFPKLAERTDNLGGYLSGGEQQMLTVGRTLMGNPALLLLDEPVEGIAPIVVQELGAQLRKLKDMGLTILLAEQNIAFATSIADRAYIIDTGRIRYQGSVADLERQQEIKEKYLMI